ncbi:MAG: VPLPA-CTERM sorting domain-containing protein [Rhodobacteraceae bacterium]|nr:VPLPA-CTERM sorting domain-containing protein [Paracoccaceae bacterium]
MNIKSLAAAACLLAATSAASFAATLTATSTVPTATSWSAEFDDLDNNGLFSVSEMTSMTSFQFGVNEYVTIIANPEIAGISIEDNLDTFALGGAPVWIFELTTTGGFIGINHANWTYEITGLSAVPLPAGGLLLLTGLAGVAGLKRRKKQAA